jgi:hypothetical protein
MAKGQMRSNKEVRKPKKDKSKEPAAKPTFGAQMKKAQESGPSGKGK